MRIIVTGGRGQLAADLMRHLGNAEAIALSRDQLDITSNASIGAVLARYRPTAVINTAAYHKVDQCEDTPEESFAVNSAAPQRLAAACAASDAVLVHISTDYVFGGAKREPYLEHDPINPINVYGVSKAAGEMAIRVTTDRHIIVRTTGLYGLGGLQTRHGNFVETMLRLWREGRPIEVVGDQVLTPSSSSDVASSIGALMRAGATGTFHVTNAGECSWYDFATAIFRFLGVQVPVHRTTMTAHGARARRPAYSVLGHEGLRKVGLPELRPWQDALADYLDARIRVVGAVVGAEGR